MYDFSRFPRLREYHGELIERSFEPVTESQAAEMQERLRVTLCVNASEALVGMAESVALLELLIEHRTPAYLVAEYLDRLDDEQSRQAEGMGGAS